MSFSCQCQPVEQASKQREGAAIDARKEGDASEGEAASNNNQSLTLTRLSSLDQ